MVWKHYLLEQRQQQQKIRSILNEILMYSDWK